MKWFGRKNKDKDELTEEVEELAGEMAEAEEAIPEETEIECDEVEETIREACERAADEAAQAFEELTEKTETAAEEPEVAVELEETDAGEEPEEKAGPMRKFGVIAGISAAILAVGGVAVLLLRKKK